MLGGACIAALVMLVGSAGATQRYVEPAAPTTDTVASIAVSDDGSRVFFGTSQALAAEDTDANIDLYERSGGTTTLVSKGPVSEAGSFTVSGGP